MQASKPHRNVAIVGGGLSGLATAAYLAHAGETVTVYERSRTLGGRAASKSEGGFRLNLGIHALYTGGAASSVLAELGVHYAAGSPEKVEVLIGHDIRRFPSSATSLFATSWLSLRDKIELARVLAGLPRLDPRRLASTSVSGWIDANAHRPAVRRVLTALACPLVYSSALHRVSADVLIDKLQRAAKHPVHYIDGGWQTLVDGMRDAATRAGAKLELATGVNSISRAGDRLTAIRLSDDRLVEADAVVLAVAPRDAMTLAGDSVPGLQRTLAALRPARLACLDVALRRLPRPDHPVVQGLDQPLFMSAQSLYSNVAPDGAALVHAFKPLDPDAAPDAGANERQLEALLDAAQPGWREVLLKRRYLPHIEAAGTVPAPEKGGMAGRPARDAAHIENLHLVGDWVGPEGFLLDASLASARTAARALLRHPASLVGSHRTAPTPRAPS